ncbi:hypothetical protein GQ42DRAFT_180465 [Ramicandelaber brevisporus]|nr:hypothetical protein GQ42DRAFT_180465 [Ramicandelaber brevisporus]
MRAHYRPHRSRDSRDRRRRDSRSRSRSRSRDSRGRRHRNSRSRSRSRSRDSRGRRRRDSRSRSRSPVRDSQPAHPKPLSTPNGIAIVVFLARDKTWINTLNKILMKLKDMELDWHLIIWRDLLEQFLLLANQLVPHSSNIARLASSIQSLSHDHIDTFINLLAEAKQQSSDKNDIVDILLNSFARRAWSVKMEDTYDHLCRPLVEKLHSCRCYNMNATNMDYIGISATGHCDLEKLVTVQRPHQIDINGISSSVSYNGWTSNVPPVDSSTAATTIVVSSPAKSALKSGKRSTTAKKKKKNKKTTTTAVPIPVRRFSFPKKNRSRPPKRASSSTTTAVARRSSPSTTELHRMLDELRKNVTRSGWKFGRYRKKRRRSSSTPLLPVCRHLRFTGKVDVAGSGNMHVVGNNHLSICHINLRMLNGLMFLQHLPALLDIYFCFTELTEVVFKKMKIVCARMNYKALRRGYVGIVVNLASVASVVDVELDRASSLYSSDFNSRFALYELILVSGIKVHTVVCYFHSGWQARSSIRYQFGQYVEKSIKSIGELHYFRVFLGDVNSVGHWYDRSRYLRLVTTPLQLRCSLWYRHLLAEYKRECNHHLEAVLMPLARIGFIDPIHLSRCFNTPARSTNIHLRLSHFKNLSPVSALDVVMLPPHLLSGSIIQRGINGGLHSFLDHTVVGVILPLQQSSTGDEIVASVDIPSFYTQQPPVPSIHIPINAPAKYHSVTTTFKFKVGSSINNISMETIVSRTSSPHKHPSYKEANALFLRGLTLLGNGKFPSSYIPQQQQQKQQQQQNAPLPTVQSAQRQQQQKPIQQTKQQSTSSIAAQSEQQQLQQQPAPSSITAQSEQQQQQSSTLTDEQPWRNSKSSTYQVINHSNFNYSSY